jgi:hypothetical protein
MEGSTTRAKSVTTVTKVILDVCGLEEYESAAHNVADPAISL